MVEEEVWIIVGRTQSRSMKVGAAVAMALSRQLLPLHWGGRSEMSELRSSGRQEET